MTEDTTRRCTRRTFGRTIGLGLFGTGFVQRASGSDSGDTERRVVGTDSQFGVDIAIQQSEVVEKEIDLGEFGTAIVGQFDPETVKRLEGSTGIRYVEQDTEFTIPERLSAAIDESEGSDLELLSQMTPWGCEQVGAMDVHSGGNTGQGVDVAIIDSGIDSDHPDLKPNLGSGYAAELCGGSTCQTDWDDDHTHGTHCSGIVAAVDNAQGVVGVSPDVTLHAVKVMTALGTGSASAIAEGISWAVDEGHDVLNISLGSDSPSQVIHDAIRYADNNGTLVVAAAGNGGPCSDCLHYPGAYEETVCVGAVTPERELAEFSSTGAAVDIAAPGEEVPSTVIEGGYRAFSGTSMAAPHVTGAAALLMANGYNHTDTRDRLLETAEGIGLDESESGAGLLNCAAAVETDHGGEDGPSATVETRSPESVESTSATLQGELTAIERADSVTVGFEYWLKGNSDSSTVVGQTELTDTESFSTTVADLEPDTQYVVRAKAVPAGGMPTYGSETSFTTPVGTELAVSANGASDIGMYGATLQGEVTAFDGGADSDVDTWFEYWADSNDAESATTVGADTLSEPGPFEASVIELNGNTTYRFVAYAQHKEGKQAASEPSTFTTDGQSW